MSLDNFAALLVIAVLYGNQGVVRLDFPSLCAAAFRPHQTSAAAIISKFNLGFF